MCVSKPRSRFSQFSTCGQFGLAVILNVSALLSLCMFVLFFFASSVHVLVFVTNLCPLNRLLIVSQNLLSWLKQEEEECDKDSLDLSVLSPFEQKELFPAPSLSCLPLIQNLDAEWFDMSVAARTSAAEALARSGFRYVASFYSTIESKTEFLQRKFTFYDCDYYKT